MKTHTKHKIITRSRFKRSATKKSVHKALNAAMKTIIASVKSKNIDIDKKTLHQIMKDLHRDIRRRQKRKSSGASMGESNKTK